MRAQRASRVGVSTADLVSLTQALTLFFVLAWLLTSWCVEHRRHGPGEVRPQLRTQRSQSEPEAVRLVPLHQTTCLRQAAAGQRSRTKRMRSQLQSRLLPWTPCAALCP